jgi:hypothetical protein
MTRIKTGEVNRVVIDAYVFCKLVEIGFIAELDGPNSSALILELHIMVSLELRDES